MSLVFTMPGKIGDALIQFPIVYHYCRKNNVKATLWLDEHTLKPLVPLFESQPCVEAVVLKPGIVNWNCGGQPWHFDLPTSEFEGNTVYHLGYRGFPNRQLTLESLAQSAVPLDVDTDEMAETPCLVLPEQPKLRRCAIHGQGVYAHTRTTPTLWRFIASIRGDLKSRFDEVVFVGTDRDRAVGRETYPEWGEFDDAGNFKALAEYISGSELVIGTGSSVVALAGLIKVPAIRVHDGFASVPKAVFANLGRNQLNATEVELRTEWPKFRDEWLWDADKADMDESVKLF